MRTNLASVLLQPTDILILDEPTNFLDLLGIIWLERYLIQLRDSFDPPTIVLVSHDRDFINEICQELIILRDHTLTYFRGSLTAFDKSIRDKQKYLTRMRDAQEKQKSHIQNTIQQNIKQGKAAGDDNKLRQAKSRQKKLDDRMGMQKSASGGRFKLNRDLAGYHLSSRAEIDIPADEKGVSIVLPMAPDLKFPGPLVSLEGVTFKYPVAKVSPSQSMPSKKSNTCRPEILNTSTSSPFRHQPNNPHWRPSRLHRPQRRREINSHKTPHGNDEAHQRYYNPSSSSSIGILLPTCS